MFKDFSIVFCIILLCLVEDIVMVPLPQVSGQPISQWSGQINGFDTSQAGMGNNGMNGNGYNGMNGNGNNGSNNGWNNGMVNGWNNGMTNGWKNESGMNGWDNGTGSSSGMGNGFMNWNNNSNFGSLQNQANEYPGGGYPASYYQQYSSQSLIVPTPANIQDFQNTTAPNANTFSDQMNGGNVGNNINYPTAFQFQGCLPQSVSTVSPSEGSSIPTSSVTQGNTDTTDSTQSSDGSQDKETVTLTRKRNKN